MTCEHRSEKSAGGGKEKREHKAVSSRAGRVQDVGQIRARLECSAPKGRWPYVKQRDKSRRDYGSLGHPKKGLGNFL